MATDLLTAEAIAARRHAPKTVRQVTFGVSALYGLSKQSVWLPINETEGIESGQVCLTIDPAAPSSNNIGVIDYEQDKLVVCYGVQAVFPGLYQLITSGKHDPSLLNPVRCTATDECTLTPDYGGWRALGCLEFLPGSLWAGADGG
jgi:hypothetical protein